MRPDTTTAAGAADAFEDCRSRLLGLAYRMPRSRAEAEDIAQDAWLRWSAVQHAMVSNAQAYLVRVTTRLCLDRLKAARTTREVYVGPWLPEPVIDTDALSPQTTAELADDLSFAPLLALDRLSAPERAAFLLHDVFDLTFSEVAHALGRSESACRQLASRGRRAIRTDHPPRQPAQSEEHARLLAVFVDAISTGDIDALRHLLTDDAVAVTDGGGHVAAALNPVHGRDNVSRLFVGLGLKYRAAGADIRMEHATINGVPGLFLFLSEQLDQTISLDVRSGKIAAIYLVRNPDKLGAVGVH